MGFDTHIIKFFKTPSFQDLYRACGRGYCLSCFQVRSRALLSTETLALKRLTLKN